MKVTTDSCLFGAWCAERIHNKQTTSANRKSVVDIGAGTGLLSLMLAQKADAAIEAVEIDSAAAQQAKENIAASPWKESITVTEGDVLQWKPGAPVDHILSNPPFYQNELKSLHHQRNVAHHGQALTLSALLSFINLYLQPEGSFFLLLPVKREKDLLRLLTENDLHPQRIVSVRQSTGHTPFRLMLQGAKTKAAEVVLEEMAIKDGNGQYTPAFTNLLKGYYLHL